jgi:hypothetical protein
MANKLDPSEVVSLRELALANSYEIAALVAVLERKGLLTSDEVISEIKKQHARNSLGNKL